MYVHVDACACVCLGRSEVSPEAGVTGSCDLRHVLGTEFGSSTKSIHVLNR